jgi:signal transduction histidine kinase/transcriptional regulator with GAF, ATPase, and Fis domain
MRPRPWVAAAPGLATSGQSARHLFLTGGKILGQYTGLKKVHVIQEESWDEILRRLNRVGKEISQGDGGGSGNLDITLSALTAGVKKIVPRIKAAVIVLIEDRSPMEDNSAVDHLATDGAPDNFSNFNEQDFNHPKGMAARAFSRKQHVLSIQEGDLPLEPAEFVACFPLMFGQDDLGALYTERDDPDPYTEVELAALDNYAILSAMTLAASLRTQQALQEQARKEKELRRLRRAGMMISSRSSLKETLETILYMAMEVTEAKYGIIRLVDHSGEFLLTQAFAGERLGKPAVEALRIDENSITGWVALKREPLVIADLSEEPWRSIYYPFDLELTMRSELAVPLIGASGRLEGVLNLESPQVNTFSKQDRYILQILATQAVAAIQEVRLLDALQEISSLLLTQPLQEIMQSLVAKACDLLNVPHSLLWFLDQGELELKAGTLTELAGARIGLADSLAGQAILTGQPLANGLNDRHFADLDFFSHIEPSSAALIVPLFAAGQDLKTASPLGAFAVFSRANDGRDFEQAEWDKKVLSILGHYAALAQQFAAHLEALRSAQEQRSVAEAFAAVGDIASNLLHRLNNKIGTIPVRVEGIQDKSQAALAQDAYLSKNLEEIEQSALDAMEIVHDSLFHLRPIEFTSVQVQDSVEEAISSANLPAGIKVESHHLADLPPVYAGPKRLSLVFVNLLENAVDAMQGVGDIHVSGRTLDQRVEVRVSDTGPGIPPELHERIFELNYSSRSGETPGRLGFGLWWVKTLMARFGGSVNVESDGRSGTTFVLLLPRMERKDD